MRQLQMAHAPRQSRIAAKAAPARAPARSSMTQPNYTPCSCGGSCPSCKRAPASGAALRLGTPGDAHEREADAVADRVMQMSAPALHLAGGTAVSQATVQRTPDGASHLAPAPDVRAVVAGGTASSGQQLDPSTRAFMEARFGRDFGAVRVHTGAGAAASARAVDAQAYTVGSDIVFGAGRYAPDTAQGRRLLAHELTHTIQQGAIAAVGAFGGAPAIGSGAQGQIQRVGECAGKTVRNCSGGCVPADGRGTGFCAWSGAIATGCVCYRRDQPMLRAIQQALFDLMIAALIAAGIIITAAAVAAIIACMMGPCEVAALVLSLGAAGAAIVMGFLGSGTGTGTGPTASAEGAASESGVA